MLRNKQMLNAFPGNVPLLAADSKTVQCQISVIPQVAFQYESILISSSATLCVNIVTTTSHSRNNSHSKV